MATNTYVALDKKTISGSSTTTISFTSIPSTYTDLVLIASTQNSTSGQDFKITLNGTSTGYSTTRFFGYGSGTPESSRRTSQSYWFLDELGQPTSGDFMVQTFNLMNYSNTTTYKTALWRNSWASTNGVAAMVGLWQNTAAVNQIDITTTGGVMNAGSTFSLYGIKAEVGGSTPKATGGTVTSDSTYWYHTFTISGNFVPNQTLSCDYLIVAGGGGGGYDGGGGGGAGGFRAFTSQTLTASNYSVLVGGGGPASTSAGSKGSNGSTSTFHTNSSTGGGGGGSDTSASGASGGSGGGGRLNRASNGGGTGNAGGYTPSEGNAGAAGTSSAPLASGGGGGASAAGDSNASRGGDGSSAYSSWGAVTGTGQLVSGTYYYAGGGGGNYAAGGSTPGLGGYGGGGNGSSGNTAGPYSTSGTANTGGGGGGGSGQTASKFVGGNGGSGIVIVRYAK